MQELEMKNRLKNFFREDKLFSGGAPTGQDLTDIDDAIDALSGTSLVDDFDFKAIANGNGTPAVRAWLDARITLPNDECKDAMIIGLQSIKP